MNRRNFLTGLAAVIGVSASKELMAAVNVGLSFKGDYQPNLSPHTLKNVELIADIILPETDTPSASQAGAHRYVDYYLFHFLNNDKRTVFVDGLNDLVPENFQHLTEQQQFKFVENLDASLNTANESPHYKQLKTLIVVGYYTSELGATQALNFDPVPGPYKEMKLKDVGKVWF